MKMEQQARNRAMDRPTVDIAIVNWNGHDHLQPCLRAIRAAHRAGFSLQDIFVVDNASTDGSDAFLAQQPDCIVLRNEGNRGFARACNQAAAAGKGDFILFLNPDVSIDPDALETAVRILGEPAWEKVGIAGARLHDATGETQRTCARFPTPASMAATMVGLDRLAPGIFPPHFVTEWDHASTQLVDQVMGAFFLVRRATFRQLGGFDEQFFVFYEDLDFSLRARRQGWGSLFIAEATAMHVGGGSTRQVPARRLFYMLRSRNLYARKHFGVGMATALLLLALFVEPCSRVVHALASKTGTCVRDIVHGYIMFIAWLVLPARRMQPA